MLKKQFAILAVIAIGASSMAGCRGGFCNSCGAGYGGYAPPAQPYTQPYAQPYVQPGAQPYVQPGATGQPPGVVVPQQVAPVQGNFGGMP